MALLIGRFVNRIDKKGRVSVPKSFRDAVENQEFSGIYVFPSYKNPSIEACGEVEMTRISSSLSDKPLYSDEHDDLATVILGNAHPLSFDPEGRVVLPKDLLTYAEIGEQALFVGGGHRPTFRIWNPDVFAAHSAAALGRLRNTKATLPLRQEVSA